MPRVSRRESKAKELVLLQQQRHRLQQSLTHLLWDQLGPASYSQALKLIYDLVYTEQSILYRMSASDEASSRKPSARRK
jgi:hypothetical protein